MSEIEAIDSLGMALLDLSQPGPAECPICLEFFASAGEHRPMSLHCGHSVCESCTGGIASDSGWTCPVCRFFTRASDLRLNYSLVEHLDRLIGSSGKQGPQCGECEAQPATLYCEGCQGCLCAECMAQLHQSKLMKQHKSRPVNERPVLDTTGMCSVHRQPLDMMCFECKDIRCAHCVNYGACKGHSHDLVLNMASRYRKDLAAAIDIAQSRDTEASVAATEAEQVTKAIGHDYPGHKEANPGKGTADVARQAIGHEFEKMRKLLDQREQELLQQVDEIQAQKLSVLEGYATEIGTHRSDISTAVYQATASASSSDTELCAHYAHCLALLQEVGQEKKWQCPEDAVLEVDFADLGEKLHHGASLLRLKLGRTTDPGQDNGAGQNNERKKQWWEWSWKNKAQ